MCIKTDQSGLNYFHCELFAETAGLRFRIRMDPYSFEMLDLKLAVKVAL